MDSVWYIRWCQHHTWCQPTHPYIDILIQGHSGRRQLRTHTGSRSSTRKRNRHILEKYSIISINVEKEVIVSCKSIIIKRRLSVILYSSLKDVYLSFNYNLPVQVLSSFAKFIPLGQEQLNDPWVFTHVSFNEHLFNSLLPHSFTSIRYKKTLIVIIKWLKIVFNQISYYVDNGFIPMQEDISNSLRINPSGQKQWPTVWLFGSCLQP